MKVLHPKNIEENFPSPSKKPKTEPRFGKFFEISNEKIFSNKRSILIEDEDVPTVKIRKVEKPKEISVKNEKNKKTKENSIGSFCSFCSERFSFN